MTNSPADSPLVEVARAAEALRVALNTEERRAINRLCRALDELAFVELMEASDRASRDGCAPVSPMPVPAHSFWAMTERQAGRHTSAVRRARGWVLRKIGI